jgi:hypothetical protein
MHYQSYLFLNLKKYSSISSVKILIFLKSKNLNLTDGTAPSVAFT